MIVSDIFISKKTAMNVRKLSPKGEADRKIRHLRREKSLAFACITAITVVVFILVFVADEKKLSDPIKTLHRNGYEEGTRTETLRVVSDDGYEDDISVDVKERGYTDEELDDFSRKIDGILWKVILGKNTGSEYVTEDLDLPEHIEGFPFDITWKCDRPMIVSSSGAIDKDKLAQADPEDEGVAVRLCATLRYRDRSEDKYSYIVVRRMKMGNRERMSETIRDLIIKADVNSASDEEMILPRGTGRTKLSFYKTGVNRGWAVLLAGLVMAVLVMMHIDSRISKEADERRRQMDEDHPKILNQYMLYYIAGMNPRAIWSGICASYEDRLARSGKNRRYAYEEMRSVLNRVNEGYSELAAYDEFASRCDSISYKAFISLVKQAVVKGNAGLEQLLYEEIDKAQRERNNRIRTLASEAETKLLLPMFMMLLTVLVFVMVPAFLGLNG